MGQAVEARGLVKRFGETTAVDGVDLTVASGGVHGLLGPNGAGKTTLLRILLGLVRQDAGTLRLFGRDDRLANQQYRLAGFVESPRFYPYLSAERNLALLADFDGGDAPHRIGEVLARVGLTERRRRKVGGYSFGMRQRLGIAAALLRAPDLLVLDEPGNGLDPAGIRDMRQLVRSLAADGLPVLLSSHHMAEVEELCDTVTIMRTGRVVYAGSLAELRSRAPDPAHQLATNDDESAAALAAGQPGVEVAGHPDGGLAVRARPEQLDAYVLALGRRGIAVRALRLESTPLESLFLTLTEEQSDEETEGAER
ncbi:ABC transporter ATP-binding protein [Streptantibioticus ferralitis]|uniref:ABC transporter ATP-binding protein n=1 Tax=Streptantibioticus ferralitis TaxID=236510 RepID=A0ABT5YZ83_9ACTN|nr:ABC transporter ATP-binding protein [Streptantibioticus ferralitis]MDF2256911.1 ABC transporter ATP-binding protein [Streptantibioticus ferralitis]